MQLRDDTTSDKALTSKLDLSWIVPRLAVGGRLPRGAEAAVAALGISAVVDLRVEARDDEEALRSVGVELHHLPVEDGMGCSRGALQRGVAWVAARLDGGRSVLVHCQHGIGRSALLACCVLADQGRDPLEALRLTRSRRSIVSPSRAQLTAYLEWLGGAAGAPARRPLPSLERLLEIAWAPIGDY